MRPGGVLMMANALYPGVAAPTMRSSPAQVAAYRQRVEKAAAACLHRQALPPDGELVRAAEVFATRMEVNVIGTPEQLAGVLRDGGFALETLRVGDLVENADHRPTGPASAGRKTQAWVVARAPGS
jgi:hypothetical protein